MITVSWQELLLALLGALVLGAGLTATSVEKLRNRLERWQDELEHERWALDTLQTPGRLEPDPVPPAVRWGRPARVSAETPTVPAAEPTAVEVAALPLMGQPAAPPPVVADTAPIGRFARVRAHWATDQTAEQLQVAPAVWGDAEPAVQLGWLNGAPRRVAAVARRWAAGAGERLLYGSLEVAGLLWSWWLLAARACTAVVASGVGQIHLYPGPWPSGRGGEHRLRRGRKPYDRFIQDVQVREQLDELRSLQLDVWLSWEKQVPYLALSERDQQRAFEESLAELYAAAELARVDA
jgi:hypothetical protein